MCGAVVMVMGRLFDVEQRMSVSQSMLGDDQGRAFWRVKSSWPPLIAGCTGQRAHSSVAMCKWDLLNLGGL